MTEQLNEFDSENILVLGAGELGMAVLRHLAPRRANAGKRSTVLVSPASVASPTPAQARSRAELQRLGVRLLPFDLAGSGGDALVEVLRHFDTVVNCTGFVAGPGTQLKLTKAALDAAIPRYFPWQFGVDYDVIGTGSGQPVFDEQYHVRSLLRSQTRTEWVIVSTGMFTSFLFEPAFGLVDFDAGIVRGLGSWDTRVTVTTPDDIGRLTADILLERPRLANQVIHVAGDTVSYGQLADIVDEVKGRRFERELLTQDRLRADVAGNLADAMARYRLAFGRGDGMWWNKSDTYNEKRGIPTTDIRAWLSAV